MSQKMESKPENSGRQEPSQEPITGREYGRRTQPLTQPWAEPAGHFKLARLQFNNEQEERIELKDIEPGFQRVISFGNMYHQLYINLDGETIHFNIILGIPGEQCECCEGSDRKDSVKRKEP